MSCPRTTSGLPAREANRRVAGLRREEVAASVVISHDYYTRIEQARLAGAPQVVLAGGAASMSNAPFYSTAMRWGAKLDRA